MRWSLLDPLTPSTSGLSIAGPDTDRKGTVDGVVRCRARRILPGPDFGAELDGFSLRVTPRVLEGTDGRWRRFQMDILCPPETAGQIMVVAARPYALGYAMRRPIRPGLRKRPPTSGRIQELLDGGATVPSRGKPAWVAFDEPVQFLEVPKKFEFSGWVLGIVEDYDAAYRDVLEGGRLSRHRRALEHGNFSASFESSDGRVTLHLRNDADLELCRHLLDNVAPALALAGPPQDSYSTPGGSRSWEGEPVERLAEQIFLRLAYNALRRPVPDAPERWFADLDYLQEVSPGERPLDALTSTEKTALLLHYVEEWPIADVASQLELTASEVRQVLARARERLG